MSVGPSVRRSVRRSVGPPFFFVSIIATLSNSGQLWTTLGNSGQLWITLDNSGQLWTILGNFERVYWPTLSLVMVNLFWWLQYLADIDGMLLCDFIINPSLTTIAVVGDNTWKSRKDTSSIALSNCFRDEQTVA